MPITREIIQGYVEEARQKRQNRATWVEKRLREDFPDEAWQSKRRGDVTTTVLEAILDDLDSYGPVA